MSNTAQLLWERADRDGDAVALRVGDGVWTYAAVREQSARFSDRLRAVGIEPGDRVLLVAPTAAEFVFAYFGILASGAVAVTVNPACTDKELGYFLDDAGCALAVAWDDSSAAPQRAAQERGIECWILAANDFDEETASVGSFATRADEDPAVLLYTSGTTGRPKGAVLSHGNIAAAACSFVATLKLDSGERLGTALPLFHVFGQVAVLCMSLSAGASLSLLRPFSGAALIEMAASHQLTMLSGVPTMWIEMLHTSPDVGSWAGSGALSLRRVASGGAALPGDVARQFRERFGAVVLDGYGLSETTAAATFHAADRPLRPGSVGQAVRNVRITVLGDNGAKAPLGEVGEVAVAGPTVMQRYWDRPQETAEVMRGDWLLTGDLGRLDADGYLWIVGRKKELIIRGGYNVYPRELEEVIYEHPAVREAAIVGVPDARLGEEIAAVVSLSAGSDLDAQQLRAWMAAHLADYKVPRLYEIVDNLPKGSTGKILKRAIDRERLGQSAERVRRQASP